NAIISPSGEMAPMSDQSDQDKSRSSVECGARALMPTRKSSPPKSSFPSDAISCTVIQTVFRAITRSSPVAETALIATAPGPRTALNQTSFPLGDQATPPADDVDTKPFAITLAVPFRSQVTSDPAFEEGGWSTKAIDFPPGEKRGWPSQPADWNRTLPIGNSSLSLLRTIGRPVSRSDVFRDFARGAPFQRHGSQRPKSLHRIKPWPQKNCKFPVLGN